MHRRTLTEDTSGLANEYTRKQWKRQRRGLSRCCPLVPPIGSWNFSTIFKHALTERGTKQANLKMQTHLSGGNRLDPKAQRRASEGPPHQITSISALCESTRWSYQ